MNPRIEAIPEKKLIVIRSKMTPSNNKYKTPELWRQFMYKRKEVTNRVNTDYYSMKVFGATIDFKNFDPNTEFEQCAVVEVFDYLPLNSGFLLSLKAFTPSL